MNRVLFAGLLTLLICVPSYAWGKAGHKFVHQSALNYLHDQAAQNDKRAMRVLNLLVPNRFLFIEESDLADKIRLVDPTEAPNHYLDLEDYGGVNFLIDLPNTRPDDVPDSAGQLPWRLAEVSAEYKQAMTKGDWKESFKFAMLMGHYCGDAHVPLHTTRYYDGQNSASKGIHSRWESKTVEYMAENNMFNDMRPAFRSSPFLLRDFAAIDFDRKTQILTAEVIGGAHLLIGNIYRADADARKRSGLKGKFRENSEDVKLQFVESMSEIQGSQIRRQILDAGRFLAELLMAGADTGPEQAIEIQEELRLMNAKITAGSKYLEAEIEIIRLAPPSTKYRSYVIQVWGEPRSQGYFPLAKFRTFVPGAVGEKAFQTIRVPIHKLRHFDRIELRLHPFDKLTAADNRLFIKKRKWQR